MNFLLFLPIALFSAWTGRDTLKWVVDKNSSLAIYGKTNVSRFSCSAGECAEPDTICFGRPCQGVSAGIALHGTLKLPVAGFDCKNRVMTGEFRKALKAGQFPNLSIAFLSLERMPERYRDEQTLKGWVEISLAGVCRKFEIGYRINRVDEETVVLMGTRSLGFSDFGLAPPRKMGGLVRVNDGLDVQFTLCLRRLS